MSESSEHDAADVPRSVGRVLDVLEAVVEGGRCNLTTAAQAAGLTPTTALRYLRALESRGYVHRDRDGDFSVGPTVVRLAAALRGDEPLDRLVRAARPRLQELSEHTGESAYLAVSDGITATYVAAAESKRAIRHVGWVGQQVPLEGSALGAALADPGTACARTGAIEADTTAISLALAPVGRLRVAVSIVGPRHRFDQDHLARHEAALHRTVQQLERDMRPNGEDPTS